MNATSKLVKAWESKNAKNAAKAGGVSLMALSLAACGGSSTTPEAGNGSGSGSGNTPAPTPDAAVSKAATTGADALTGGSGNDSFSAFLQYTAASVNPAATTTLSAADSFSGSTGTDTLTITVDGTPNGAVTLPSFSSTSVESIEVRNVSGQAVSVDLSSAIGMTGAVNVLSTFAVDFNNIGTADLTITGNDVITNAATTFSSGSSSQTDAFTLNITGGVGAGAVTSDSANDDWTAVTINSTGGTATATTAANVVGALDLAAGNTMQTLEINATSSLTTGAIVGWNTTGTSTANKGAITVKGAGAVNVGTLDNAVESLNASANSGGVTVTLSNQTDFQYTGSTGVDIVTTGAVLSTSTAAPGAVAGGTGNDRLVVADSTHITSTVGAKYTSFEVLQVQNGVSVDLDNIAGITDLRINQGATATGVTDLSAAQAAKVTIVGTGNGAVTVGVKSASTVGQVDTVTLAIDDGASAVADLVVAAPVLTGVENLVINAAADAVSISALTSAASLTSVDINATHASLTTTVTSGAIAWGANSSINASDSTAAVEIVNTAATANAVAITGGSGNDLITAATAVGDIIDGGAGIDVITVSDAGATGNHVIKSTAVLTANADVVVGFATTEDDFDFNGTLANGSGAGAGIAAAEIASAATITAALATAGAANDIVFIATTDLSGTEEAALDAFDSTAPTAAQAQAVVDAIVGTGGAFNGAITNLDTILGASDSVLFQVSTDTDTAVFRITNTTATGNTLTADEVALVAVFEGAVDLVAADYI